MKLILKSAIALGFLLAVLPAVVAQSPDQFNESLEKGLKWRSIGPYRGGRVLAVTGVAGDPNTFYFGGVGGGVWRTTNAGLSWTPLFDKQPIASIGAIAVSDSNPNVIYAGTGEACIRGNISYGNGVYKSTDGGKTWLNIGLTDTQHIASVIVHPRNPDIVYVAALGHAYGPNDERGVFRTTNGGKTWEKVLFKDNHTGAIDISMDPHNPNVLFAALYQVQRTPWSLDSGGPGSGLYQSTDGGMTWKHLEGKGLPTSLLGRIGVSVSGADSNRVYSLIEAKDASGLYRSDDGGENWTKINDDQRLTQRAWYFTHIFADPKSVDTVYMLNTGMFRSQDAGKTLELLPALHGDHHGLWIDPRNPQRMINGNDGGAAVTIDGGKTWTSQENQPTAQFYHVSTDNQFLYYVYGAQQDNSTVAIASRTDDGYIGRQHWYDVAGGESGYVVPDPRDFNIVYAGSGNGVVTRWDKRTMQAQDVTVWPVDYSGHGAKDMKFRLGWTQPIVISPHDADVLYTSAEMVFKSTDHGRSWSAISPDLTRNDKSKQESSGGPITKDNTSVEFYDTVFTIAESPKKKDLLWAGTDDGLIQMSPDGGKTWQNVTPKGMPEWSLVSMIEASPHDAASAYAAVDGHKLDDLKPYIYKTSDSGKTWTKLTKGIPNGAYVHVVREDPVKPGMLYAGTETGIFVSCDAGANWQSLQLNLPVTPIHDLVLKNDDLVVATHGRSFWILDDISPLRQLAGRAPAGEMFLLNPSPTYRVHFPDQFERRRPVGENPPNGAILTYFFKTAPKGEVTLEILDEKGALLRRYSSVEKKQSETPPEWPDLQAPPEVIPAGAGFDRFTWDLRYDGPHPLPGEVLAEFRSRGPYAGPGNYQVKLSAEGKSLTVPLQLRMDPRVNVPASDIAKEFDLELKIRETLSSLHDTVREIRETRVQLRSLRSRLQDSRYKSVSDAADSLDKKMTPIEEQLLQVNAKSSEANLNYPNMLDEQLHYLTFSVEVDDAPTQQQYAVFEELSRQAAPLIARWKEIRSTDLAALNTQVQQNVPAIYLSPAAN
ncbi:MAG TPA: hypothetical protein VK805_05430 [Candidatus Baltobacteraceae bacterium]|nr:hypothetical protein [Candidatus Baltobacteraceae bacterium]